MKATATWPSGRSLTWEDGTVSGDPLALRLLKAVPEITPQAVVWEPSPYYPTADYEKDVMSFIAAIGVMAKQLGDPKFEGEGLPTAPATPAGTVN